MLCFKNQQGIQNKKYINMDLTDKKILITGADGFITGDKRNMSNESEVE